jgi:hypothetical protein
LPATGLSTSQKFVKYEVKLKLLDQMYHELNGKDDNINIDDTGWFAFCLNGPFVNKNL